MPPDLPYEILTGDCREVLRLFVLDNSVDACVTDPPYGLTQARPGGRSEATRGAVMGGFMGLAWDCGVPGVDYWREVLRVLKPGGHLLAFGGTRTYHRLACSIEDAGFELRDTIAWLYGSGFPKSKNLKGEQDGWGTALKPAHEPIVVARKPLEGTVAENVLEYGTGAINVDGCRIHSDDAQGGAYSVKRLKPGATLNKTGGNWRPDNGVDFHGNMKPGRWPANVIHDGSDEVLARFPDAPGQIADASSSSGRKTQNAYGAMNRGNESRAQIARGDTGSAARFFYCAKASKKDRGAGNTHPTVKPTELMRYLCRLVTPPGGTILDPFTGSGSTGKAAVLEGFKFLGVELETPYAEIARRRIQQASA